MIFLEPIFRLGNLNNQFDQFDIKIDTHSLKRAKPYMHLGVDLDKSLSRDSLLHNIVKKVSAVLGLSYVLEISFPVRL